ncbi:magnesium chelatase subunit ChlI family protein [Oceanobacillus salinisoli]
MSLENESSANNETSEAIRERVTRARKRQFQRYGKETCNATIENEKLLECTGLTEEQEKMMRSWASKYNWSTRVQMKIRRLARTKSDLTGEDHITNEAIWEAVTMRRNQNTHSKKGIEKSRYT